VMKDRQQTYAAALGQRSSISLGGFDPLKLCEFIGYWIYLGRRVGQQAPGVEWDTLPLSLSRALSLSLLVGECVSYVGYTYGEQRSGELGTLLVSPSSFLTKLTSALTWLLLINFSLSIQECCVLHPNGAYI
jgi:hypothetical protein